MDILEEVKKHHDCAENYARLFSYVPFTTTLVGSQNYNLDTPQSDVDTKTIMVPKLNTLLTTKTPLSTTRVMEDKSQCDIKDIRSIIECWKKQNINFVEMLFTKYYYVPEAYRDLWAEITAPERVEQIAHYNTYAVVHCIQGSVAMKHKAMLNRHPSNEKDFDKYGYGPKDLHHLCRLYFFLLSYLSGKKTYLQCLASKEERKFLLSLKTNPVPLDEATAMAERYHKNCDTLAEQYYQWHQPKPNREVEQYLADWMVRVFCRVNSIKESDIKC